MRSPLALRPICAPTPPIARLRSAGSAETVEYQSTLSPALRSVATSGCAEPFLGGLGDERSDVRDGRVLQQRIEGLHAAELRGELGADRILVQVEDDDRREVDEQARDRTRLGRLQQHVVAVEVGPVGGAARERRRAVGIRARQDDDVEVVEHAREAPARELLRDDDQRLGAGRLVAVLAGEDHDARAARRRSLRSLRPAG